MAAKVCRGAADGFPLPRAVAPLLNSPDSDGCSSLAKGGRNEKIIMAINEKDDLRLWLVEKRTGGQTEADAQSQLTEGNAEEEAAPQPGVINFEFFSSLEARIHATKQV